MLRDPGLIPLSHDHQHALALCVLAERALNDGGEAKPLAQRIVEQYETDLRSHFDFEEAELFPLLADLPVVAELIAEHQTLRAQIPKLRTVPTRASVLKFCAILRIHVRKEEAVLFEEAQRRLSRQQLDQLAAKHRHMMKA